VTGPSPVQIAVAGGPAFTFLYPDNVEALSAAGAELVPFDPLVDASLPADVDGLLVGGGFPEVYAEALADNRPLLVDARRRIGEGLVTWAECGGLLWLAAGLDGRRLCGVLPAEATMTGRLTLGYRRARARRDNPLSPAGAELRGHEFHYSRTDPPGDGFDLQGRTGASSGGWVTPTLVASYLHLHLGARQDIADRFVATCRSASGTGGMGRPGQ
jgi:cobyrinic acid a,c-diamide synthase